jgi:hypothetical protein
MSNYTGQNLTGYSFVGQNLTNAIFTNATLTNADFSGCNLTNAVFGGAIMRNAGIPNTNLSGVVFTGIQAAQLLYNSVNQNIAYLTTRLNADLQAPGLPSVITTILTDDVRDLPATAAAGIDIISATTVSPGIKQAAITVSPRRAFYINGISLANNDSLTLNISLQSIGTINNPTVVTTYTTKTFTISRSNAGVVSIVDSTAGSGNPTVTNALLRLGNVVYKIHGYTMIGVPYDINTYTVVNVGLYDILSNSAYLDGQTGPTGPRGATGTSGVTGLSGPTGAASLDGPIGPSGPTGPTGQRGVTGPVGRDGLTGVDGRTGTTGPDGEQGDAGQVSGVGASGSTGPYGPSGPTGQQGIAGIIANVGPGGAQGPTGAPGLSGGLMGLGATGPTGPMGTTNAGVWTVINPETPENTTGYTNINYYIPPLNDGENTGMTRTTVGINTATAGGPIDIRYTMDVSGIIKTVGMNSVSDYRIKTNVRDLPENKTVDGLRPVKYTNRLTGREEYGFLAHELQEVYPEMVVGVKDDGIGYQTIQYDQLFAIFIAEIKKLRDDVETAEAIAEADSSTESIDRV